jgi:hypothetical protein
LVEPGSLVDGLQGNFALTPAGQSYAANIQGVFDGMSPAEQAAIAKQLAGTGQFRYTATDAAKDAMRDVQVGTRLDGLGQATMGAISGWASGILCPMTGWGCAGAAQSADEMSAGL